MIETENYSDSDFMGSLGDFLDKHFDDLYNDLQDLCGFQIRADISFLLDTAVPRQLCDALFGNLCALRNLYMSIETTKVIWETYLSDHSKRKCNKDYSVYLASDHWKDIRERKLASVGYKCQLEASHPADNLHVHHNTYENLGHESLEDLIVLCAACHAKFHDKENSSKKNPVHSD